MKTSEYQARHSKNSNWFFRTPDAHAGLASLALAQDQIAAAVTHAETALALLSHQGLAAASEPFAVYWRCVDVLQAGDDPQAQTVAATAYQQLQEIAKQLESERLRQSFLNNVAVNRSLVMTVRATLRGERQRVPAIAAI